MSDTPLPSPSLSGQLARAVGMLVVLTALTGVAYPLVVTAAARLAFPRQASGSLLVRDGRPVGSRLIGQSFAEPRYFWGRLSATGSTPYDPQASGGSNLGPTNPALTEAARARIAALRAADPGNALAVPVDLVTASGSGLDPHITPAAAAYQVARVARVRHLPAARVEALVRGATEGPALGIVGEARVNVLALNLALDGER